MIYATVDKDGKFNGTVYTELTQDVKDWHAENGFTYVEMKEIRLEDIGTEREPDFGEPAQEQSKAAFRRQALEVYEKAIEALIGKVPNTELSSWAKQEAEARNLEKPTPMIDQLIVSRGQGETREELATKIIANADAYAVSYAQVLGEYQAKLKEIEDDSNSVL